MTINERIFIYRKKAGLTQEQAAERIGMKHSTYAKMELRGRIDSEKLVKIAELLGVSTYTLLYGEEPNKATEVPYVFPPETTIKPDEGCTFNQPPPKITVDEYIPTARELAAMKTIHSLPKNIREKIYNFIGRINQYYQKNKKF